MRILKLERAETDATVLIFSLLQLRAAEWDCGYGFGNSSNFLTEPDNMAASVRFLNSNLMHRAFWRRLT